MPSRDHAKLANLGVWRAARRRQLDRRLHGFDDRIGPDPALGWIRTVREALGMSGAELAARLGVSRQRVDQLENAEVARTMPMSTLDRVAAVLGCRVRYVFVPDEALERMVRRQALRRAVELRDSDRGHPYSEEIAILADDLIDRRGLWRIGPGRRPPEPL